MVAAAPPPDNHLSVGGWVIQAPERRYNPAGIPIARFRLEHSSIQEEGDRPREVRFRIQVIAAGEAIQAAVDRLEEGTEARVTGFVSRAGYRQGDYRLVLHAQTIEILAAPDAGAPPET
ncbi:MAG: primosomal replication protein N [Pseudomonadota bacterium]